MSLEDYLELLQQEGTLDSSGQFGLDIRKARSRLGVFFRSSGWEFLPYWLRFAAFYQPPKIYLDTQLQEVMLEFGARGPQLEETRSLFALGRLDLRYLQMAVVGALQCGFTRVELETPHYLAWFDADQQGLDPERSLPHCRLRAQRELPLLKRLRARLGNPAPLRGGELPYLSIPCIVNGRQLIPSVRLQTPRWSSNLHLGGRPFPAYSRPGPPEILSVTLIPLEPTRPLPITQPRLHLAVQGAAIPCYQTRGLPADCLVVLECPQVRLDLSLTQLSGVALADEMLESVANDLAQMLIESIEESNDEMVSRLPLAVGEWLCQRLCEQQRRPEALVMAELFLARPRHNHPFEVALLERRALLRSQQLGEPAVREGAEAEAAWERLHLSQAVWKLMHDCGAIRLATPSWLVEASRALRGDEASAFFRECVRRSVNPQRLNFDLLAHFKLSLQQGDFEAEAVKSFLVGQLLAVKGSVDELDTLSRCLETLMTLATSFTRLDLCEEERHQVVQLVILLGRRAVALLDEEMERLEDRHTDSEVLKALLRRDQQRTGSWGGRIRFRALLGISRAQRILGQTQEAQATLQALDMELGMRSSRYDYSPSFRKEVREELELSTLVPPSPSSAPPAPA